MSTPNHAPLQACALFGQSRQAPSLSAPPNPPNLSLCSDNRRKGAIFFLFRSESSNLHHGGSLLMQETQSQLWEASELAGKRWKCAKAPPLRLRRHQETPLARRNHPNEKAQPQISPPRASEVQLQAPGDKAAAAPQIRPPPPEGRTGRGARHCCCATPCLNRSQLAACAPTSIGSSLQGEVCFVVLACYASSTSCCRSSSPRGFKF